MASELESSRRRVEAGVFPKTAGSGVSHLSEHTSLSLLDRLREVDASSKRQADWRRFLDIYEPLLRSWAKRQRMEAADADDLVQSVMTVVVRRLADFQHNGRIGAFRTWLRTITFHCVQEFWRARAASPAGVGGSDVQMLLAELEDPDSPTSHMWDQEHDRHVMHMLLQQLRDSFDTRTWQAFEQFALLNRPAADVAKELNMTTNAVFIAKSRVLTRLKRESAELLDN